MKTDPMKPEALLLIKLGAIAVYVEEMLETKFKNVEFDLPALQTVFDDEVRQWIKDMGPLLPAPAVQSVRRGRPFINPKAGKKCQWCWCLMNKFSANEQNCASRVRVDRLPGPGEGGTKNG